MISRICVTPIVKDSRSKLYARQFERLGLSGKISEIHILDSYLIESRLLKNDLNRVANALTNKHLERFSIDEIPEGIDFTYAIEIGYLPGVTDNVAHTAKEIISDLLHLKENLEIYTSKIFLIASPLKPITDKDAAKISYSLYNPLIERASVFSFREIKKSGLPKKTPAVRLKKLQPVLNVSLSVSDKELEEIGALGIKESSGIRRGPLALSLKSMKAIQGYFRALKRNPTDIELETLAQTWSEHCKHTIFASEIDDIKDGLYKTYIKGATNLIRKKKGNKDFCVSVFSDNAGGIVFDNDYLIAHKVETHNSPSALDPFGGAITGIVGVNRDIIGFGLGAKPVANTYGFCFGEPEDTRPLFRDPEKKQQMLPPLRIIEGVVKGINAGGNTSGIPTISGFARYDERFRGKPLVFAGTVGLIPRKIKGKPAHEKRARPGDYVVMVGGGVGRDGIHGATFSSLATDKNSPSSAVQIGDPITQKKLSDAIIKEARDMHLYNSITDNGAGGLSSSVLEMAKESGGVKIKLENVPLKYPGLRPWEIWISESQERMTLSVPKKHWKKFKKLMESRGVVATVIGEFSSSGNVTVTWNGKKIMDMSMEFLHNGFPKQKLITKPYAYPSSYLKLPKEVSYTKALEKLLSNKNLSGFSFISDQYDHEVQASSVLKPTSGAGRINTDAQVFQPVLSSKKGVVLSYGVYPSYGDLSIYDMAACALDTAVRNIISTGGTLAHTAILDNFCWCSSNDPVRLSQLKDAARACYDCAIKYETPFVSGKDSMFNDFKGFDEKGKPVYISIPPTLLISAISVMTDLHNAVSPEFKKEGDVIYLLGETHDELGGGEYLKLLSGNLLKPENLGGNVPKVNLEQNLKTYSALEKAIKRKLVASSSSLNSGGLSIALAKASVGGMLGCEVSIQKLPGNVMQMSSKLFSESQGRILISINPKNSREFEKIVRQIPYIKLGKVSKNDRFVITDGKNKIVNTDVKKLFSAYHNFSDKMKEL